MKISGTLVLVAGVLLTQTAMADGAASGRGNSFAKLQRQVNRLAAQVHALQHQAADSSVEGRTYCFVLDLTIMRGRANNGTEELQRNIIRRSATFSGGTFTGTFLSNVLNQQLDDGTVNAGLGNPIDPLLATYVQTDNKIDVSFGDGSAANWYVSKDGSYVHGSSISHGAFGSGGVLTIGFVRNWSLVEGDNCDMEAQ